MLVCLCVYAPVLWMNLLFSWCKGYCSGQLLRIKWGLGTEYFFSTKPRDGLGRTSPKWPILRRAGHKTLTQVSQYGPARWKGDLPGSGVLDFVFLRWHCWTYKIFRSCIRNACACLKKSRFGGSRASNSALAVDCARAISASTVLYLLLTMYKCLLIPILQSLYRRVRWRWYTSSNLHDSVISHRTCRIYTMSASSTRIRSQSRIEEDRGPNFNFISHDTTRYDA